MPTELTTRWPARAGGDDNGDNNGDDEGLSLTPGIGVLFGLNDDTS
jgi:hypothetical protein